MLFRSGGLPLALRLSEGLGGTLDAGSNCYCSCRQDVRSESRFVHEGLDHGCRAEPVKRQDLAQSKAWLTKFDAPEKYRTNLELMAYEFIQPHATGNEISACE